MCSYVVDVLPAEVVEGGRFFHPLDKGGSWSGVADATKALDGSCTAATFVVGVLGDAMRTRLAEVEGDDLLAATKGVAAGGDKW